MFQSLWKFRRQAAAAAALAATAFLAACGGGGGSDTGSLRLAMTDAPSCGYDAVNVTVEKVRVHKSAGASETDGGWSEVVLDPARRVDLLGLQNGVLTELGSTPLPTGKYTQMRLVLASNGSASPLANSVVPSGGSEVALTTPSGQQSGLKMNIDIDIASDKLADFVLDFDACKSVVRAGNSGRYLLKPVVSVIPRYVSGVTGFVEASLANGATTVSLQQGGVVVKATTPDSTGSFLLQPVAPGSYDLVMTAPGRATAVVTGVAVTADTVTPLATASTALTLPSSQTGTADGTVSTGTSTVDATVRALQTLAAGPSIEVAGVPVDNTLGTYSYALPVAPPVVAAFVAAPAALSFSSDTAAAAKYTLAASDGVTTKTAAVTVVSGTTVTTGFTFP